MTLDPVEFIFCICLSLGRGGLCQPFGGATLKYSTSCTLLCKLMSTEVSSHIFSAVWQRKWYFHRVVYLLSLFMYLFQVDPFVPGKSRSMKEEMISVFVCMSFGFSANVSPSEEAPWLWSSCLMCLRYRPWYHISVWLAPSDSNSPVQSNLS